MDDLDVDVDMNARPTLDDMVGRRVAELWMSPGEEALAFVFDDGSSMLWSTTADCCSETWFADIVGPEALGMGPIALVESVDMDAIGYNVADGRSRQSEDSAYGYKITTFGGGVCDIVLRNSSNGYYGGKMVVGGEADSDALAGWTRVTEDFGAPESSGAKIEAWTARREARAIDGEIARKAWLLPVRPGRFKSL